MVFPLGSLDEESVVLSSEEGSVEPMRPPPSKEAEAPPPPALDDWDEWSSAEGSGLRSRLRAPSVEVALSLRDVALRLLSAGNDAVGPPRAAELDATMPLAHYWHATSHNSYVVGDQHRTP